MTDNTAPEEAPVPEDHFAEELVNTGIYHYQEATRLLRVPVQDMEQRSLHVAEAQVHATLFHGCMSALDRL